METPAVVAKPDVEAFFDPATYTITYVVSDPATKIAAIIDPVLDYDPKSGRTRTLSADEVIAFVKSHGLNVEWIIETHAHADHVTAAPYLKEQLGAIIGIGSHITAVQKAFAKVFNTGPEFKTDGSQFDHLFRPEETFNIGELTGRVIHTPGHTPACSTYLIGDAAFVGDTLFMPDFGTARCDFPGGDAATLFRSIGKIYGLPPDTRLFMCHDYQPGGRPPAWETTVRDEMDNNIHVQTGTPEERFVEMRNKRDATLEMPTLILPAVQINMRAGQLPPPEQNGMSYLKIPINAL
ncbi:MBL fold metallo-hydrolase [Hoeflea sp. TYP-13]|uniref:MBL fold metallo-hydrolase n=1 Tax=Hoeflea sp. TYP-13 TaxID=3230023 RepID=UPI0034C6D034